MTTALQGRLPAMDLVWLLSVVLNQDQFSVLDYDSIWPNEDNRGTQIFKPRLDLIGDIDVEGLVDKPWNVEEKPRDLA